MSGNVNKVILVGHLGRNPEIRTFQNGGKVCNLNIATTEGWKDKDSGERKTRTEWHRVTVYNDIFTSFAERYLRKGSKVYLEGQLETRKYTDKDGVEKYSTEVVLRQFRGDLQALADPVNKDGEQNDALEQAAASSAAAGGDSNHDEIPF